MEILESLLYVGFVLFVLILLGITLYNIDRCQKRAVNELSLRRRNDFTTVRFTSVVPPPATTTYRNTAKAKFPRENGISRLFVDITKPLNKLHGHNHNNDHQQSFASKNTDPSRGSHCSCQKNESETYAYKYMKTSYKYFQKGVKLTKEKANDISKKVLANSEASSSRAEQVPGSTSSPNAVKMSVKKIPPPRPPPPYKP